MMGYDRSGSENEDWVYNPEEIAGKKAARNWINTKVETDLEKGLDATYRKQETPVGEIDISAYKDAAREKLRASPTDLESFIKTKGQDFYGDPEGWFFYNPLKQEEAEAHGVGDIYDDYYMGASEGKDIRDAYSSIPLEYASQLAALEAKETREGLEAIRERQYSSPWNEMYYAGGGIAGIRRPWAIPPESGPDPYGKSIPKMAGGGRIGFFKGAQADTRSGKAMSPGTSADYSPGQGHREARETRGAPPGITTSPIPQPITPVTRNESSLFSVYSIYRIFISVYSIYRIFMARLC